MAVEGEGDAHDLAVPAGELQAVRAPAASSSASSRPGRHARGPPASGMAFQQEAVLLHQPIDALGVDRGQTVGSPLALEERGDPPVPVGRSRVDQAADLGGELDIAVARLRPALRAVPCTRSITFERATPSVSVIVFTGNRPGAASATARSVFLPARGRAPP